MPDLTRNGYQSSRVHQATGMVAAQASVGTVEALVLLKAKAVELDETLEHTALDVIDGALRFD
jgi:hypothetical protein